MRSRIAFGAELVAARAVGRLSRLSRSGGGTTLPGKMLVRFDPASLGRLAARLPEGCALVSATNGKTTTTALADRILRSRFKVVTNSAGANLVSGVASALLEVGAADLGVLEVDEAALPEIMRLVGPRAVCLGNLFRDQLDRYGELEALAQRWRGAVEELRPEAVLVVNGDDPVVAALAGDRTAKVVYGVDDRSRSRAGLQHAADSTRCASCGAPYAYDAVYAGHLGEYRCPACGHGRPALDLAARSIDLCGLEGVAFDLATPTSSERVSLALPGLYNVYNALAASALGLALGVDLAECKRRLEGSIPAFGRFERIPVAGRTALLLLVKNPTGANEVVHALLAGDTPPVAVIALNDEIADGRDVSWIWDVDWEPLLERLDRVVVSGSRAAELALRLVYAGYPQRQVEVETNLSRAFDRGVDLTPAGGVLAVLPTYTAMLALRGELARRGLVRPYWKSA